MTPSFPPATALALLGALGLVPLLADGAQALPDYQGGGQQNVEGLVPGSNAAIRVVGERGLVRWHSFSVAPGEVFRIEGNPNQAILNLVSGPDASRIGGLIESGPRFLLSNPNGIEILGSGRIVAPGVWLTTGRIDSEAWLNRSGVYAGQANDYLHISLDRPNAINLEGTVLASDGSRGGSIGVFAESIHLGNTARLEANGPAAGGQILVGGSWQNEQAELHSAQAITAVVDQGAVLEANATIQGDGGTIVVWSDITNPNSRTRVDGTLHARGGPQGGDGGRIETSGYWLGVDDIKISTEAPLGLNGEWLLDPFNIIIGDRNDSSTYALTGSTVTGYTFRATSTTYDSSRILASQIGTYLNSSNVTVSTGNTGTQPGTITISSPITKSSGSSITTLRLQAASSISISSNITATSGGMNLILDAGSGSGTVTGKLSLGPGSVTKEGAGTITIRGNGSTLAYPWTGATIVNNGILRIDTSTGSHSSLNSFGGYGPSTEAGAGSRLEINNSSRLEISGTYRVDFNGSTFAFGPIGGGRLHITSGNFVNRNTTYTTLGGNLNTISGTQGLNLDTGFNTFNIASGSNATRDLVISASLTNLGSVNKLGTGRLAYDNNMTYAGQTLINDGSLIIENGGSLGTISTGTITNNASLIFNRSDALDVANAISGTGSITQVGAGTTTLTGNNTYTGTTTISAGTLSIGNGSTTGTLGTGAVTNNAALIFNRSDALTVANAISGTGSITQAGAGTTTLTGSNNYSGTTTISAGNLAIGNGSTSGTLGTGAVTNNAALIFNRSNALTVANAISGTGSITQSGAGTTALSGNNSYTGSTILSSGTLALGSTNALGSAGTIDFLDGILQFSAANTNDYSSRFSIAANQFFAIDTNGQSVILASALTSSGGALNKLGLGTLTLTGNNTYTGTTTISAGTLSVGNGSTTGTLGTGAVTNNAALIFNRSNALTVANAISGTGSITQSGAGTTALSGNNSYTGSTILSSGTLALGSTNALGSVGTIEFLDGILQFSAANTNDYSSRFSTAANQFFAIDTNSQSVTLASALNSSGGALNKLGLGTLTLTANSSYTGTTTITAGTLAIGNGSTTGTLGTGAVTNNAALIFNRSDALAVANAISGTGSITQSGAGTTTLTGDNTYTGTTTLGSGTVAVGAANALGSTGTISLLGGTLQFSAANTTDYSARFSSAANLAYIIDTNGQAVTFASALTSTGGALTKLGLGTLTLTANNTYTGVTLVQAGFLSVLGRGPTSATCTGGSSNLCGSSPTPSPVSAAGLAAANTAAIGTRSNTGNAFDRGALNSTAPPLPLATQPEPRGRSTYSFLDFNRDGAMNAEASDQTDRPPSP